MAQKKPVSERQGAEKRYQALIEKRDELNAEAAQVRGERNTLNDEKKKLMEEMKSARELRNELAKKMKEHKNKRNQSQEKAKQLIALKRSRLKEVVKNLPQEIEAFKADIKFLEMKQQTSVMTLREENDLLDKIRKKSAEVPRMEQTLAKQSSLLEGIDDFDKKITELFDQADKEHELVVQASKEHQEAHDKYMQLFHDISHLTLESNKKHDLFLALRERADLFHQKAQEMRKKVIALKREQQEERSADRKLVQEQNKAVKAALLDSKKLDTVAEDALKKLLNGGKIEL